MKNQTKHSKLFLTLVLLMLAVLCVVNVSYSYFTSTSTTNGEVTFSELFNNYYEIEINFECVEVIEW